MSRISTSRRHRSALVGIVGVVAALALAVPAAAAQPTVLEDGTYDQTYVVPAAEFPCGVDATFHEVGTHRIVAFEDGDGQIVRLQAHIGGTTTITTEYGRIVNHWRENATLDPEEDTVTWSGSSYNIHGGAGGVLVNRSGRWVEDATTGEVQNFAGPSDDPEERIAEICAVLAP
jgi:hypothetical protein